MEPTKQREVKEQIFAKINEALSLIPKQEVEDLPVDENIKVPAWHDFEHKIWKIGESIRQLILKDVGLRKDEEIQNQIALVALDKKAKRGRQSFIILLGYKNCSRFASALIEQINDEKVTGQIISVVTKMQVFDFKKEVEPYCLDKMAWIRNGAKKYLTKIK